MYYHSSNSRKYPEKDEADILVPPSGKKWKELLKSGTKLVRILVDDVGELINKTSKPADLPPEEDRGNWRLPFDRYHGLYDIYGYLDFLASEYPEDVFVENIGKTYEGRDIKMIKICKGGCGYRQGDSI